MKNKTSPCPLTVLWIPRLGGLLLIVSLLAACGPAPKIQSPAPSEKKAGTTTQWADFAKRDHPKASPNASSKAEVVNGELAVTVDLGGMGAITFEVPEGAFANTAGLGFVFGQSTGKGMLEIVPAVKSADGSLQTLDPQTRSGDFPIALGSLTDTTLVREWTGDLGVPGDEVSDVRKLNLLVFPESDTPVRFTIKSIDLLDAQAMAAHQPEPQPRGGEFRHPGERIAWISDFESPMSNLRTNSGAGTRVVKDSDGNHVLEISKKKGNAAVLIDIPKGLAEGATGIAFAINGNDPGIQFDPTVAMQKANGDRLFADPNLRSTDRANRLDSDEWQTIYMPFREHRVDASSVPSITELGFFFFGEASAKPILLDDIALVRVPEDEIRIVGPYTEATPQPAKLYFSPDDLPALREKIKNSPTLTKVYAGLKNRATEFLQVSANPYEGFFSGEGKARTVQGRALHSHVLATAFVGLIEEDEAMIRHAKDMLVSACRQYGPNEIFQLFRIGLNVGDMALPVMIGYDWLNAYMSDEERVLVKNRVYEYGAWVYAFEPVEHWGKHEPKSYCSNWTPVIQAPAGLASLLLDAHPEWKKLADFKVNAFLEHSVDPDGAPRESGHYLSLGSSAAYSYVTAVKRLEGRDLLAPHRERLAGISRYFAEMILPWGSRALMVSQGDAAPDKVGWFIKLSTYLNDPLGYWLYYRLYGDPEKDGGSGTWGVSGHPIHKAEGPFVILYWDDSIVPKSPTDLNLPLSAKFVSGQATARTGWDPQAAMVHFKSDEIYGGWSHADDNTFSFVAYGESLMMDSGAAYYFTQFHNGLLIDGKGQAWKTPGHDVEGKITAFEDTGHVVSMTGDATAAYARFVTGDPHLPVERVMRHLHFVRTPRPAVVLIDEIAMQGDGEHDFEVMLQHGQRREPAPTITILEYTQTVESVTARRKIPVLSRVVSPATGVGVQLRADIENTMQTTSFRTRGNSARIVTLIAPGKPGEEMPEATTREEDGTLIIDLSYSDGTLMKLTLENNRLIAE